jgi:hypothetical protein
MDWQQFISAMFGHLAWPVVIEYKLHTGVLT